MSMAVQNAVAGTHAEPLSSPIYDNWLISNKIWDFFSWNTKGQSVRKKLNKWKKDY